MSITSIDGIDRRTKASNTHQYRGMTHVNLPSVRLQNKSQTLIAAMIAEAQFCTAACSVPPNADMSPYMVHALYTRLSHDCWMQHQLPQ